MSNLTWAPLRFQKAISICENRFFRLEISFCQTVLKFHFSTNFSIFVHGDKRVPQDKKDEMTMDQTGDILKNLKFEMDL